MSETIIKTERLSTRYGGITAVDKLFLEIRKGEVFVIIKPRHFPLFLGQHLTVIIQQHRYFQVFCLDAAPLFVIGYLLKL